MYTISLKDELLSETRRKARLAIAAMRRQSEENGNAAMTLDDINNEISQARKASAEDFPDPDDRVFYEVALSKDDSYVVTGNMRHFPRKPIVVSPAQFLDMMEKDNSVNSR
jgi:predicted nucleic acid-binding protein